MSYILDALKKSSEERQKLDPESGSPHPSIPASPPSLPNHLNRKNPVLIIILLGVIASIAVTGTWAWYSFRDQNDTVKSTPPYNVLPSKKRDFSQLPQKNKVLPNNTQTTKNVKKIAQPSTSMTDEQKTRKENASVSISFLEDLPFGIRASVPLMKFSGHAYSENPERRMIMINSAIVREGDMVSADLILLEITENGVIMKHRGTSFRLNLF